MEKFLKHKTTELKPTDEIFLRLLSSKSSIFPPDEEKCREKKLLQESRQLGYEKDFAQAQCKFEAAEKLKLTIALKAKEFTDATKALNTAKRRLSATIDAYEYAKAQSWDEIIVHLEGRLYDYHKAVEEKEKLVMPSSCGVERVFSQLKHILAVCGNSPTEEMLELRTLVRCNASIPGL